MFRGWSKTSTTILWLLEDPESRVVVCATWQGKEEFLVALSKFSDPRVASRSGVFWASRVLVSGVPKPDISYSKDPVDYDG